jgi:splicing factor 3B subunit 3
VLSIGETVEEVNDSGFLGTTPSLRVGQLGDDSLMQVRHAQCTLVCLPRCNT